MPELPEVETVVRQLGPQLAGLRVRSVRLHTPHLMRCQTVPLEALRGARFVEVRRRGKFIRCRLSLSRSRARRGTGAPDIELLVHLGMTGRLTIVPRGAPRDRHDHVDLLLEARATQRSAASQSSNGRTLRFRDVRKFGRWWLLPAEEAERLPPLADLGPEPLEISREQFRRLLSERRQQIKALLLNQRRLAGMGNIYCDEALFAAAIHPQVPACRIPPQKLHALWRHMRRILRAAIRRQGSTISDFVRPDGRSGTYQDRFKVYGRAGAPCPRCGATLERIIAAGRGTTLCPLCQRRPRFDHKIGRRLKK